MGERAWIRGVALGSDPLRMRGLGRWLERLVLEAGFAPEDARSLAVAFGEACANVHRHADGGRCDGGVELRVAIDEERVVVTVRSASGGRIALIRLKNRAAVLDAPASRGCHAGE